MSPPEDFAQASAWKQIDHQLVRLKIQQASASWRERADRLPTDPKGNVHGRFVAWADQSIDRADKWTEKVYAIYLDVWEQQHKVRTAAFLLAVFQRGLIPVIEARIGVAKFNIEITAKRLGMTVNLSPLLERLLLEKSRLIGRWRTRIEIEARELELQRGVAANAPMCRSAAPTPKGTSRGAAPHRVNHATESLPKGTTPEQELERLKLQHRYSELVQRVPAKLRAFNLRMAKNLQTVAPGRPGRPRKDERASEALRLQAEGKSYAQIARIQNTTPEAVRKLIKSRTRKSPDTRRTPENPPGEN